MELGLTIFLGCCMFVMGSLFGSFFSLATYRIPRKEDIVSTRSYCPCCKHRLGFFDLIPILSFLIRKAKCHYCGQNISSRYFLLEFFHGCLFVILYLWIGYNGYLALIIAIYAIFFVFFGSKIMKGKMTEEEKKEVNQRSKQAQELKLNQKSGVFISELVIAFVLFIATFITIILVGQNTSTKVKKAIVKANANQLLIKNMEICLATKYDQLESYTHEEIIDGVHFRVTAKINSTVKEGLGQEKGIKRIDMTVSYAINGTYEEVAMETLKGKSK